MTSKMILDLDRAAGRVLEGARNTQEELQEALNLRLEQDGARAALGRTAEPVVAPGGDNDNVVLTAQAVAALEEPDVAGTVSFAVWMIDFYRKRMLEADEQHQREIQEDWRMREVRDEAARLAYEDLIRLRKVMEGALHPRVAESAFGIVGPTPSEPLALARTLGNAVDRLRERHAELPEIRIAGMVQDWEVLTDALEERYLALQGAIDAVTAEVESAKRRRRAKDQAVQRYRDAAVGWTGVVRHLLIAVGLRDTAEELPATSPRRQSSSPVSEPLPDEGDLPVLEVPPLAETPDLPTETEEEDLPIPANEPEVDADVA